MFFGPLHDFSLWRPSCFIKPPSPPPFIAPDPLTKFRIEPRVHALGAIFPHTTLPFIFRSNFSSITTSCCHRRLHASLTSLPWLLTLSFTHLTFKGVSPFTLPCEAYLLARAFILFRLILALHPIHAIQSTLGSHYDPSTPFYWLHFIYCIFHTSSYSPLTSAFS